MNVIALPIKTEAPALPEQDKALHDLLRKAVASHRSSDMHTLGSLSGRQKNAVCKAYLDAVATMLDKPGLDVELGHYLAMSVFDIRKLSRIANSYGLPDAA